MNTAKEVAEVVLAADTVLIRWEFSMVERSEGEDSYRKRGLEERDLIKK